MDLVDCSTTLTIVLQKRILKVFNSLPLLYIACATFKFLKPLLPLEKRHILNIAHNIQDPYLEQR